MSHYVLLVVRLRLCDTVISETTTPEPAPVSLLLSQNLHYQPGFKTLWIVSTKLWAEIMHLLHLIVTEHLKWDLLPQSLFISCEQSKSMFHTFTHNENWRVKPDICRQHWTVGSPACLCLSLSLSLSVSVVVIFQPAPVSVCVFGHKTTSDLVRSSNGLLGSEYANCFLAVGEKLLDSPFKLHPHVWLQYSAEHCQECQISGSKAWIKAKRGSFQQHSATMEDKKLIRRRDLRTKREFWM